MAKDFYFNDHISTIMLKGLNQKNRAKGKPQFDAGLQLTNREKEILELICKELTLHNYFLYRSKIDFTWEGR